jgi:hypothetical protein
MTDQQEQKLPLWSKDYIIENLPSWIYSDNPEPKSTPRDMIILKVLFQAEVYAN